MIKANVSKIGWGESGAGVENCIVWPKLDDDSSSEVEAELSRQPIKSVKNADAQVPDWPKT